MVNLQTSSPVDPLQKLYQQNFEDYVKAAPLNP